MRISFVVPAAVVALLASTCALGPSASPAPPSYWPTGGFRHSTPEEQGTDAAPLVRMLDFLAEQRVRLHSMVIVRHGYVILDACWWPFTPDDVHDIASCTKSLTSTVAGIALAKGLLKSLDAPLLSLLPQGAVANRTPQKEAISLRHLLTMTSGMECRNEPTELTLLEMTRAPDWVRFALDRPMASPPGERFVYDSAGCHLLSAAIARAAGISTAQLARDHLFNPLGIGDVVWPADPQGIARGWGDVRMRPHDMAKIGLLFLHDGVWDGTQVVPSDWARAAVKDQSRGAAPGSSYGYLWWPAGEQAFYAAGRGGQYIYAHRGLDMVVVTTAGEPKGMMEKFNQALNRFVGPAMRSDRPLPPNPAAVAELKARVDGLARPPQARAVPEPPALAKSVSGTAWALEPNPLGWESIAVVLDAQAELGIEVAIGGAIHSLRVGLDGVPRINKRIRFAEDRRYDGASIAFEGSWRDGHTLALEFDVLGLIENGTIELAFASDSLRVSIFERTMLGNVGEFLGRPVDREAPKGNDR